MSFAYACFISIDQQIAGVGYGGFARGAEHADEFFDSLIALHFVEAGNGATVAQAFGNEVVVAGKGRHLGEVGDGDDLVVFAQFTHFEADGAGDFAAHVGVDFIEDEQGGIVLTGKSAFEREHDAGHFAAGGDEAQGFEGFAGVGAEEEVHHFLAMRTGGGAGGELHGEEGLAEAELAGVIEEVLLQYGGGFAACLGEGAGGGTQLG